MEVYEDDWAIKEKFALACCVSRNGDQNWVSVSRTMKAIAEACGDNSRSAEWYAQKNIASKYYDLLNTSSISKRKIRGISSDSTNIETPTEQVQRKLTFSRIEELDKLIKSERERYSKLKRDIGRIQSGKLDSKLPDILKAIKSGQPIETLIQDEPSEHVKLPVSSAASTVTALAAPSRPQRAPKETEKFKKYIEQRQKHNAKYHHHHTPSGSGATTPTVETSDNVLFSSSVSEVVMVEPNTSHVQSIALQPPAVEKQISESKVPHTHVQNSEFEGKLPSKLPTTPIRKVDQQGSFLTSLLASPATEIKAQVNKMSDVLKEQIKGNHSINKESYQAYIQAQNASSSALQLSTPTLSKLLESNNPITLCSPPIKIKPSKVSPKKDLLSELVTTTPDLSNNVSTEVVKLDSNKKEDNLPNPLPTIEDSSSEIKPEQPKEITKVEIEAVESVTSEESISDVVQPSILTKINNEDPKSISDVSNPMKDDSRGSLVKIIEVEDEKKEIPTLADVKEVDTKDDEKIIIDMSTTNQKEEEDPLQLTPVTIQVNETDSIKTALSTNAEASALIKDLNKKDITEPSAKKKCTNNEPCSAISDNLEPLFSPRDVDLPKTSESPKAKRKPKGRPVRPGRKKNIGGSLKIDLISELESDVSELDSSIESKDHDLLEDKKIRTPLTPCSSSPASPALSVGSNCDNESAQQQRAWRKSIMLVWKAAASHKYANVFLHPVTDDEAPGYSSIIYKPMDLSTIKKNIESGVIQTTTEFQRDVMLMFQNALMYNRKEHDVYRMAREMRNDVLEQIQSFISTQLMVQNTERDSKTLRVKGEAPGHARNSTSKTGFSFLSL